MKSRLCKIALVGFTLAAYSAACVAGITTGSLIVVADDAAIRADGSYDMERIWIGEDYCFGGNLAHIFFAPANTVDRTLRPDIHLGTIRPVTRHRGRANAPALRRPVRRHSCPAPQKWRVLRPRHTTHDLT
jgi:hypothetical protein